MITSEIYYGKIHAGATKLACSINIEQTAPMQLTIHAGKFCHTDGKAWTINAAAIFNIASDPTYPTECKIEIGDIGGVTDVLCASRLLDNTEEFDIPPGWNSGHVLVFPFVVPAGCVDLDTVEICILTVLPGYPDGTTAADWQMQSGGA